MRKAKIYLASFASFNFHPASFRFYNQALDMGIFENIFIYNECNLDMDYKAHFRDKIYIESSVPDSKCLPLDSKVKFTRGYGYWSWKPQVVLQTLEKIEQGDILLYIDVGCHLVANRAKDLLEKLKILEKHDIVGFKSALPCHNRQYTKASVLKYFNVLNNEEIINDRQIKGGVFFCKKSDMTLRFMREWRDIIWEHFELVDDSKSSVENLSGFLEHRHDQSIFDLLMRKYGCFTFTDYHDYSESDDSFGILDKRAKINMNLRNKSLVLKILSVMGKWFPIRSVRKDVREIVKMVEG